jgi:hypothetical protein
VSGARIRCQAQKVQLWLPVARNSLRPCIFAWDVIGMPMSDPASCAPYPIQKSRMPRLRFVSIIKTRGINPYIRVNARQAASLKEGWRKALPVVVRINGKPKKPWRINMMPAGNGSFYLYLHETVRKASNTKPGDRVMVDLSFDRAYRSGPSHSLPRWFSGTLAEKPKAKKSWDALIPSRKKEILRYFALLKSPEAKARNLQRVMYVLSGDEARFMARSWKSGK